jgi:hypothetical protein
MPTINASTTDQTAPKEDKHRYEVSTKTLQSGDYSIIIPVSTFSVEHIANNIPLGNREGKDLKNRCIVYQKKDLPNGLTVTISVLKKEDVLQYELSEMAKAEAHAVREAEKFEAAQTKAKLEALLSNPAIAALLATQGL